MLKIIVQLYIIKLFPLLNLKYA